MKWRRLYPLPVVAVLILLAAGIQSAAASASEASPSSGVILASSSSSSSSSSSTSPSDDLPPPRAQANATTGDSEGVGVGVLPPHQRIVRYLVTDDPTFGVQVACSVLFLLSAGTYSLRGGGDACYQCAIGCVAVKQWGSLLQRVRLSLLPQLLSDPPRYAAYRASAALIAAEPCVQHLLYCALFLLVPMGPALAPLALRELAYSLLVGRQVLALGFPAMSQIISKVLTKPISGLVAPVAVWQALDAGERRRLLGLRVAQGCYRLELALVVAFCFSRGLIVRTLRESMSFVLFLSIYIQLLRVKRRQLDDRALALPGAKAGTGLMAKVLDVMAFIAAGTPPSLSVLLVTFLVVAPTVRRAFESESPSASLKKAIFDAIVSEPQMEPPNKPSTTASGDIIEENHEAENCGLFDVLAVALGWKS
jgi:hypothetical protein